ncbi:activating signal cointegrator 1 complex subunit 1-like [Stylonychia lemnae]|uniref:Activating signal cointegrator 1 complex subunit 1-like n=1 Tax=Stylonychia lemnae TaxID=5949 RepID=A0A078ARL4_STYLE|nr:activating signal cointegrator 1 complex subunit 1-like [Stylonychia lemnae]|eukprot:CDW84621.1 activating signal cointegrator 1 complex subunit 1-like [Stylonychia lemnae]
MSIKKLSYFFILIKYLDFMERILNINAIQQVASHRKVFLKTVQQASKPYFTKNKPQTRKKGQFTHFLSLPMATESLAKGLEKWKQEILAQKYETIYPRLFQDPNKAHFTLCMLTLQSEQEVELAREAMRSVEEYIQKLVVGRGQNGKLFLEFDNLGYFGSLEETNVIHFELKEEGEQFELLKDVIHVLIKAMIDYKVIDKRDLSHIRFNSKTKRFENEKLHLTLINSSFGKKELMQNNNRYTFIGRPIIENHKSQLKASSASPNQIQLSTRFHYDDKTGFYLSQYNINI